MPSKRLDGRSALVTGASRGLGKAIALALAAEGAAVAVVARSESQWNERLPGTIHETVGEITDAGGSAVAVAADLSKLDEVESAYARARETLGPLDLLVNNAALTVPGRPPAADESPKPAPADRPKAAAPGPAAPFASFLSFPLQGVQRHLAVGLFATYRLMQLALPDMIEQQRGAIVNISSAAGLWPGPGPYGSDAGAPPIAYGGNKAAIHHLTQCVAAEMQAHGIAVNALLPSAPIITPGNLYAMPEGTEWASPEDFAEATIQTLLADPNVTTGRLLWDQDVLHPELGTRGWLGG